MSFLKYCYNVYRNKFVIFSIYNMSNSYQSIRFCVKCENKYYHRMHIPSSPEGSTESEEPVLTYYCRVCGYEDTDTQQSGMCVLDTQKHKQVDLFSHIYNPYTKHDPTLPHIFMPCPNTGCQTNDTSGKESGTTDVVYLRYNNKEMKYLYICTVCEFKWKNE